MANKCECIEVNMDVVHSFYEKNMKNEDRHFAILGWESEAAQLKRFSILSDSLELSGKSLLDVGCGLGDLNTFLFSKNIHLDEYIGIDINPNIIDLARTKQRSADFRVIDIIENPYCFNTGRFSTVFSSGIFNLKNGDNMSYLEKAVSVFSRLSREFIVFNLLSENSTDQEEQFCYYSKATVIDLLESFQFSKIDIVEGYLNNDFTVICKK